MQDENAPDSGIDIMQHDSEKQSRGEYGGAEKIEAAKEYHAVIRDKCGGGAVAEDDGKLVVIQVGAERDQLDGVPDGVQ